MSVYHNGFYNCNFSKINRGKRIKQPVFPPALLPVVYGVHKIWTTFDPDTFSGVMDFLHVSVSLLQVRVQVLGVKGDATGKT